MSLKLMLHRKAIRLFNRRSSEKNFFRVAIGMPFRYAALHNLLAFRPVVLLPVFRLQ